MKKAFYKFTLFFLLILFLSININFIFLSNQAKASVMGLNYNEGYFTSTIDGEGWGLTTSGFDATTATQLYDQIYAYAINGGGATSYNIARNKTAGLFIANTLLYPNAPGSGRALSSGEWSELKNRLIDREKAGNINFNKNLTFNINSLWQRTCGTDSYDTSCNPAQNNPDDAAFYSTKTTRDAIVIYDDNGNFKQAILKDCGNVAGISNVYSIPNTWNTTVDTTVDKATARVGESATWTATVTVTVGPVPTNIYYGFKDSQQAGSAYNRDSNYILAGKTRGSTSLNTSSLSFDKPGQWCRSGSIENDAEGYRYSNASTPYTTTTDIRTDSPATCVTVNNALVNLTPTATNPTTSFPGDTVSIQNGITRNSSAGVGDYRYRLSNTFVSGNTPTWNNYQTQSITSGVPTVTLSYTIPSTAPAGQQICRRIEIDNTPDTAPYNYVTVTTSPNYADSCVTVGSYATLSATSENQTAYRGDTVTLRNIITSSSFSGSGNYSYTTSNSSVNSSNVSITAPATTADSPNTWIDTGSTPISTATYDNVKFTIPNDAPVGTQYCRTITITPSANPQLTLSPNSAKSCVVVQPSTVNLTPTAPDPPTSFPGDTVSIQNGITRNSSAGVGDYRYRLSHTFVYDNSKTSANQTLSWNNYQTQSITSGVPTVTLSYTIPSTAPAGQQICRRIEIDNTPDTAPYNYVTVTASPNYADSCVTVVAPNQTTLKATATNPTGTYYRGSNIGAANPFRNGISVISSSGTGSYTYKKSTIFKLGTTPTYGIDNTANFGATVSDIDTTATIPNTAVPGDVYCIELVINPSAGVSFSTTNSGYLTPPQPPAGTSRSCVTVSASSVSLNATSSANMYFTSGTTPSLTLTNGITATNPVGSDNYTWTISDGGSTAPSIPTWTGSGSASIATSSISKQDTFTPSATTTAGQQYCRKITAGGSTPTLTVTANTSLTSTGCAIAVANDSAQINARSSASTATAYPGDNIEFQNWAVVPTYSGSSTNKYSFSVSSSGDYSVPNTPALIDNQSVNNSTSTINRIAFQIPNDGTILAGKKYCTVTTIRSSSFTITSNPASSESCVTIGGSTANLKATATSINAYPGDTVNLVNGVEIISKTGAGAYTYSLTDDGSDAVKPSGWTDWSNLNGTGSGRIEGSNVSVPFSINIPLNAAANTKYCRKITINDSALNPSLTFNQKSATSCITVQSPTSWNISPSVSIPAQDYSIGDNIVFTYNLTINGTTPNISIPVNATNSGKITGNTGIGSISPGSSNRTITFSSSPIRVNSYGSYCSQLSISDYASGSWTPSSGIITPSQSINSEVNCVEVSVKPRVNIIGGDLTVGKGTAGNISANAKTNWTVKSGKTYGSWTEYGIFGTNTIYNMSSAAQINGGIQVATCDLISNMTFSNITNSGGCGGNYSYKSNMKNYKNLFKTDQTINNSTVSLDSLNGNYSFSGTSLNISSTTPVTGKSIVINAPNTTVFISSNIDRVTTGLNPTNIPQVVIIAKNIKIKDTVTNIDSWLLAPEGNIDTCSLDASTNPLTVTLSVTTCALPLTINGPLVANKLYLLRTTGANISDVSEKITLPADSYLWLYNRSKQNSQYYTTYSRNLPPRL